MSGIKAIKGFNDVLPPDSPNWQFIEATSRRIFAQFGFSEIRVPLLEKTELFSRSIGDATDIVEKEMYTFSDKGGSTLTLRPEGTAGVIRALVEHKLYAINNINKLYYMGPMFRHERPQKGRYRQFHQIGAELVGASDPFADAQLLVMVSRLFSGLGLDEPKLHINSLGCKKCRPDYRARLVESLKSKTSELCEDCTRRMETNPLRVLDCKVPACISATVGAPSVIENLCNECSEHFGQLQSYLSAAGIEFQINNRMVRGLDYYTRTTFEVVTGLLGAQSAVAAGGRYDGLVEQLGGPELPGIGFALGLERVALLLGDRQETSRPDLFIAMAGDEARIPAIRLMSELQKCGLWVETDTEGKSLKSQMRRADRLGARYSIVIGSNEIESETVTIKKMDDGLEQKTRLNAAEISRIIRIPDVRLSLPVTE